MRRDRRLHDCLDGSCEREQLTMSERRQLARIEAGVRSVASAFRAVTVPDLSPAVLQRIATIDAAPTAVRRVLDAAQRAAACLVTPRPLVIDVRPAYAGAFALAFCIAATLPLLVSGSDSASPLAANEGVAPARIYVQFELRAEGASRVTLAGTFSGWQPKYEMREAANGVWRITLPLEPGVHDYAFVADDGQWLTDPYALQVDDGFGSRNNRIALATPMRTRQL